MNSVLATEEKKDGYRKFYVHGARNCIDLCESMVRGEIKGCFIEMNMCSGGCIKGPTVEDESISRFKVKLDMEETIEKDPAIKSEVEEIVNKISFQKIFMDRSPREPMRQRPRSRRSLRRRGRRNRRTS